MTKQIKPIRSSSLERQAGEYCNSEF